MLRTYQAWWLAGFKLTLLCIVFTAQLQANQLASPPNIILVVSDYMGYADIEPFGAKDIKTPTLNRLAAQGITFLDHYAAAPSCIPSRASLLSGRYPQQVLSPLTKSKGHGLSANNNNLLKQLKLANYNTGLIGKWHLGSEDGFHPNDHGFDYFLGFDSWTLDYYNHQTSDGEPGLFENKQLIHREGYLTDIFTEQAISFIDANSTKPVNFEEHTNNPFFLYLSLNGGLPPYQKPNLPKSEWHKGWDSNVAKRSDYISMIEHMDSSIGRVLKTLDKHAIANNTLIIFTYDHGGRHLVNSGDLFHGFGTLWEGGIRVPFIMSWPEQIDKSKTISKPTIAMDITSTLINAANPATRFASDLDGVDLFDFIKTPNATNSRSLFWSARGMTAMRQGDWKYVVDGHSQFLFNIKRDAGERQNLFYQYPKRVNTLKQALNDWQNVN